MGGGGGGGEDRGRKTFYPILEGGMQQVLVIELSLKVTEKETLKKVAYMKRRFSGVFFCFCFYIFTSFE